MDNAKKKMIKRIAGWICAAALVIGLAVLPLAVDSGESSDGPQASILSGTVGSGGIVTEVHGGGTLAEEDAVAVTVPSGVLLTEFLVSNGDTVAAGDPLANVDRVTVMTAIARVQDTLEYLREEMESAADAEASDTVTAQAGGLVKAVYARSGDSVQDVMLEYGALAVLSLDGLMAVEIQRSTDLQAGDFVWVALSDGTEAEGRVESNLDGVLTVTLEDEGYTAGETVRVTSEDGDRLGSGELYIHSEWKAVAYSGTVKAVKITENGTVSAGGTLFTLTDTENTAQFELLAQQHREYEQKMLELFRLYQDTVITAPSDGVVSGVDEDSACLLSDTGASWVLSLLANAPNGDDETGYTNFIGMVTGMEKGLWQLVLNPEPLEILDYKDLTEVPTDPVEMTQIAAYLPEAPIFELVEGEWVQVPQEEIQPGDILLFAGDEDGEFVWIVRNQPEEEVLMPEEPSMPTEGAEETVPAETTEETLPQTETESPTENETQTDLPSAGTENTTGSTGSGMSQGGAMSGFSGSFGGQAAEEETFDLYSLEDTTILSVTPQETMTLSITVDEQDVGRLSLGMEARIAVDALKDQNFTAQVTEIGTTGENSGGSSKFTVTLTLDRQANMLAGMNATASLTLASVEDVVVIPVAALNESGSKTLVYTSYDAESGTLGDPVEVTLGASDGENAQILTGLEAGAAYYYAYYDTLEISDQVESAGGGFSFNFRSMFK